MKPAFANNMKTAKAKSPAKGLLRLPGAVLTNGHRAAPLQLRSDMRCVSRWEHGKRPPGLTLACTALHMKP